ncbi:A-type_flavoprotein [Hexamita inflata]|uniref:A-type_flavoprotein n=1 Tax=Hexamita inflata TaxID=28002 RepID=A0ABP1GFJ6_9EUKA
MPLAASELVAPDVYWVGAIDWSVRVFHGYHTDEGTSYNAYLLMDEEVTLIDTVKVQFGLELLERIKQITFLDSVKYVIMNHAENDHSGALPFLMTQLKNATIVTNKICMDHLILLYPSLKNYPFKIVNNSTQLQLKTHTIHFLQVPMLHWPDSMFSYCAETNILFSNDGFGQHIACSERFMDQIAQKDHIIHLMREYSANILGPFQVPLATALDNAKGLKIDMILTAHGISWRGDYLGMALNEYIQFSQNKQMQKKLTVVFQSMNGAVKKAAQIIMQGSQHPVQFCDLAITDLTKCALSAYESEFLAIGSPTYYGQTTPLVESAIHYLRGLSLIKGRKVMLFGSFCWSDKAVLSMKQMIENAGGTVVSEISFKMGVNEITQAALINDLKKFV